MDTESLINQFKKALKVPIQDVEEILGKYAGELYDMVVPPTLHRELRCSKYAKFFRPKIYSHVKHRDGTNYIRFPASIYVELINNKETLVLNKKAQAFLDAMCRRAREKYAVENEVLLGIEAFVKSVRDHKQLFHLWPGVAIYATPPRYRLSWPKHRKKFLRSRKLTPDEVILLTKFTMLATPMERK